MPLYDLKTLETQIGESLVTQRLIVLLSAAFGALAALLAALGIYGVLAFAVAQRRQEIGVRIALGADPASVRRLVLSEVVRFLVIGAAIGLPAAYALARAVSSILFGIGAGNPGDLRRERRAARVRRARGRLPARRPRRARRRDGSASKRMRWEPVS